MHTRKTTDAIQVETSDSAIVVIHNKKVIQFIFVVNIMNKILF